VVVLPYAYASAGERLESKYEANNTNVHRAVRNFLVICNHRLLLGVSVLMACEMNLRVVENQPQLANEQQVLTYPK
jgi:hypothetical protein